MGPTFPVVKSSGLVSCKKSILERDLKRDSQDTDFNQDYVVLQGNSVVIWVHDE